MQEVATSEEAQAYYNATTFKKEWAKSDGYPAWVAAFLFIAFIFVVSFIGGVFAEGLNAVTRLF